MAAMSGKDYIAAHNVDAAITQAVAAILKERPADPVKALGLALQNMCPSAMLDSHMHVYDPAENAFSPILKQVGFPSYTPEEYAAQIADVPIIGAVHIEAAPSDGAAEATWINSLIDSGRAPAVKAIVAGVDLGASDVDRQLALVAQVPRVVGIRWMLDWGGPPRIPGGTEVEYLLGANASTARFEAGFALLAKHNLSFDLQCGPKQLEAAAALCARHPDVKVVIDHMGKPGGLKGDGSSADAAELAWWRCGMAALAHAGPHVYCKLSMLGYAVPGWYGDAKKEAFVKGLVLDMVRLFGAKRCMFASNWHMHGAMANTDTPDASADPLVTRVSQLHEKFVEWVSELPVADRVALLSGTAREFYRV